LNLGIQDCKTAAIVFSESGTLLLHDSIAFGPPLEAIEDEVSIIKRHDKVAGLYCIAGAYRNSLNKSFERCHDSALHFRLKDRFCSDTMLSLGDGKKQAERNDAEHA